MCKKMICGILLVLAVAVAQPRALADELVGLSDVTVVDGAIVSLRYGGTEYVVAEGDLLLGTTSRWYIQGGNEVLWEDGATTPAATVAGTSTVKAGDVGSKADNFLFTENGATNISSIDGIDFQQTIFTFASTLFFLFERGGNDSGTWQAIYADGSLGTAVAFTGAANYSNTGVSSAGQNGFGVVFITSKPAVGVRITASGHDTLSISAPVPVPVLAVFPSPEDEATDVDRNATLSWAPGIFAVTHNVYLGESFQDVNSATVPTVSNLDVNTFDPASFEFDTTYYWRVDEVNGTPDKTVFKGNVWRFTAEPYAIQIPGAALVVTASSFGSELSRPEKTIDGSGLDGNIHGIGTETMWFSATPDPTPWIQYEFDAVKKLSTMKVWNSNGLAESSIGWGVKDVQIEYSLDGEQWEVLADATQLSRATGSPTYSQYDEIDFEGAAAKFVRLNIQNNWGGILLSYSLSEVQFYTIPTQVRTPMPASGSVDVAPNATAKWRAGRDASEHTVYMSTDSEAVAEGSASAVTTIANSVSLSQRDVLLGETYYWRVDEVNETEAVPVWAGPVWSFSTPDAVIVDDFEGYGNLSPNRPFQTWLDGFGYSADKFFPVVYAGNGTGSGVGHDIWSPSSPYFEGSIMEETLTLPGSTQSLPFYYKNTGGAAPQIDRKWAVPQDWTLGGAKTLVLHFYGDPENTGQLYVKINNGAKVTYTGSASAITTPYWTQWNIDLASLGVNLKGVTQLSIGADGGSGVVYLDDIQLYREAPAAAVEQVWIEAESGVIAAPMQKFTDKADASAGAYIGTTDAGNQGDQSNGVASFTFTVQGGTYKVNARVITADAADSFWVRLPGATMNTTPPAANNGWIRWNGISLGNAWHWDDIHNDEDGSIPVQFTLAAGTYTLEIAWREDGALLDAIVITDQL